MRNPLQKTQMWLAWLLKLSMCQYIHQVLNSEYKCFRFYTHVVTKGNLMQAVTLLLNLTQLYQTNYKLFWALRLAHDHCLFPFWQQVTVACSTLHCAEIKNKVCLKLRNKYAWFCIFSQDISVPHTTVTVVCSIAMSLNYISFKY